MSWLEDTNHLQTEETVLRATLAQRPGRPPLPSSPPPPVSLVRPVKAATSSSEDSDEGHPSTSSSDDDSESARRLKFERKSPSPSRTSLSEIDYFQRMPYHVMTKVFSRLEIHERARAAQVCRRWYNILTSGRCPLENVVVLNVFQKSVWESTVSHNAGSNVQCIQLPDTDSLVGILLHVFGPHSVKIWYNNPKFAKLVLKKLAEIDIQAKSVDIFPYTDEVGIELYHEFLPELVGITMRPHGTKHFWDGLDLNHFPAFEKLDTLILDSFNLRSEVELPESITTFEFHNRRAGSFAEILPKLRKLTKLEYIHIGHADFQTCWPSFLEVTEAMPNLSFLLFRFCRFSKSPLVDDYELLPGKPQCLKRLQFMKLDLCYGYMPRIISSFLSMTSDALRMVAINMISDEAPALFDMLYDQVARSLRNRGVMLYLGLLQKSQGRLEQRQESEEPAHPVSYALPSDNFERILSKFEASFCEEPALLDSLFLQTAFPCLNELKFIQCPSLNNAHVENIAANCPRLKKLSLLSCDGVTNTGILAFIACFWKRTSKTLDIIWKRDNRRFSRAAGFYLEITSEHRSLLEGMTVRFFERTFNEHNNGQGIVIRDRNSAKTLVIQDFDQHDNQRILGVVLPFPEEDEPPEYAPPPVPEDSVVKKVEELTLDDPN